ncbi:hypothetical protein M9458_049447, partial [Cirrhinus mrigala]
ALRYMELLPPERRPIAGTAGADYRKKQMAKQLPDHDQDPERCHELSPGEATSPCQKRWDNRQVWPGKRALKASGLVGNLVLEQQGRQETKVTLLLQGCWDFTRWTC